MPLFLELDLETLVLKMLDYRRRLHKHKCNKCGIIWEHMTPPPRATAAEYAAAHLCPAGCGIEQRIEYEGP